ncbi:intraflagellar transport-associated protein [Desmodus rotundus]|uniref:intraflagellar transport-associated protein n=1 Tax=Desmodus rotundus TaxID=9430 RepID=UPI002380DB57|nr:intraflagellar transport-associated protein [Desmodus rotundus]XP_045050119.2 intraflagellar transport-associated protein [Desmodus rotundus]XP_045050123.2 intraflagellar transport-associated protein [Desmodus rotundus]XP_045050126.2 intraflagellar transport-associated protein [Desmodus rotundus]XP_045050128.2 intraflagellar transport-associated protein [Desmodus rotundus]XP_045050131.2 intraflagellar transport-associated protein [Desmodus rotundus]XP_045050132.2 intraflagellar transport-a
MPAQTPGLEIMEEDQITEEVLDKFVNCHEQTYEEFLSTFTHLSKEDNVTKRGAFGTHSSKTIPTSTRYSHRNEANSHCLRSKAISPHTSWQCSEEEQMVLDEGQGGGSSFQGDLNRAGKVKVDNFLAVEDLDVDEEIEPQMSKDLLLLLPGEVEQDVSTRVPSYVPSIVAQPLTPGVKPGPLAKGADEHRDEVLGDEVQPFRLDDEFDYDAVMLTPKFTPAEIDAIKELSMQRQENTDSGLEEPRD